MKTIRTLIIALAVTLTTAIQPLRADEAVDAFKKEIDSFKTYAETKKKEAAENPGPATHISVMREMSAKLKAVKTEGLPADLKTAFTDFLTGLGKMSDVLKDFPEKAEEIKTFIEKKVAEDPAFMAGIGQKMATLGSEMTPLVTKLQEVGKKYGIESFGLDK